VQITCCYENFCDKHIKEEIMKNFTCPNCKVTASLKNLIPNKKLREDISWYKNILAEAVDSTKETHSHMQAMSTTAGPVRMNNIIDLTHVQEEIQNSLKKLDIDMAVNKHDLDMTPEEKMQMFNNKLTESHEDKPEEQSSDPKITPFKLPPTADPNMMGFPSNYIITLRVRSKVILFHDGCGVSLSNVSSYARGRRDDPADEKTKLIIIKF
jgi:hypothetical protein